MSSAGGGFISVFFTIDGVTTVERQLATFGHDIGDMTTVWTEVGQELLQDFVLQFDTEGGVFGGGHWDALADATVLDRARKGYGGEGPMEVRTGRLKAAVTQQGAPGNVFEVTPSTLTVGVDDDIAGWQHFGTSRGIPPRALVGLSFSRQSQLVDQLNQFVQAAIISSGLGE